MFETKEKKYNKCVVIEICVDRITTKLQSTYNNKILIKFNNVKK